MRQWRWVSASAVYALHDRQIAEHGGAEGVRDQSLIESALARPQNAAVYGEPDAADLAAEYCYGLARNHGFFDGNKRIAVVVAELFLKLNGVEIEHTELDAEQVVLAVAKGEMAPEALANWYRSKIV